MTYADALQKRFPGLDPQVDDLFLLEAHQIAGLPTRAPSRDLSAVLHAHPRLRRFFVARYPPIEEYLAQLLAEHDPADDEGLPDREAALLWRSPTGSSTSERRTSTTRGRTSIRD